MAGQVDYLDIFDEGPEDVAEVATRRIQQDSLRPEAPLAEPLVKIAGCTKRSCPPKRIGVNSRGSKSERDTWNLRMQVARLKKQKAKTETDLINMLVKLRKRSKRESGIKIYRQKRGGLFTKHGLVKISFLKTKSSGHENVTTKYSMGDFLEASFGSQNNKGKRILSASSQGLALGISGEWVAMMRSLVAGSVFAKQANRLAKLYVLAKRNPPLVVGLREAFDETAQLISVSKEKGSWQIIVLKQKLTIVWPGESSGGPIVVSMPIICPPLLVLSPSADRLFLDTGMWQSCDSKN